MNEKDKELLLKDLCARLPYGVKVLCMRDFNHEWYNLERVDIGDNEVYVTTYESYANRFVEIEAVKPYLFPLSSMTEEQSIELFKLFGISLLDSTSADYIKINECTGITFFLDKGFDVETHLDKLIDWLNKNHFDYRGLIGKGLAIDATGLNIY